MRRITHLPRSSLPCHVCHYASGSGESSSGKATLRPLLRSIITPACYDEDCSCRSLLAQRITQHERRRCQSCDYVGVALAPSKVESHLNISRVV